MLKLVSRSFCVQQSDFHFLVAVCEASSEVRVANVVERRAARRANVAELRRNVAERRRTSPNDA